MLLLRTLTLMILLAAPAAAHADMDRLVADHILPRHQAFARSAQALSQAAWGSCDPQVVIPAFQSAYDDWMGIQHIRIGPIEEQGRGLAIAFWPDPKGMGIKVQRALMHGDPAALQPDAFATQSIAARGLTGLERLIFPQTPWPADACPMIRATSVDLARLAAELQDGWTQDFAPLLLTAGQPENTRFLTPSEARQAMFTQIVTGLEYIKDQRLGRPMGSFDRPTPERAEARAAGRSLRNVALSLQAIRDMVATLSDDDAPDTLASPDTLSALDRAIMLAQNLNDPILAGTATPQGRLRVEILQQSVDIARQTALDELGPALGVTPGFNAMDGD